MPRRSISQELSFATRCNYCDKAEGLLRGERGELLIDETTSPPRPVRKRPSALSQHIEGPVATLIHGNTGPLLVAAASRSGFLAERYDPGQAEIARGTPRLDPLRDQACVRHCYMNDAGLR